MSIEDLLVYGIIGLVIIVLAYIIFNIFTPPQTIQIDSKIFSLKECEKTGFTKEDCFKLSKEQVKKIRGQENS